MKFKFNVFDVCRQCEEVYDEDLYELLEDYFDSLNKGEDIGEDFGKHNDSKTEVSNSESGNS